MPVSFLDVPPPHSVLLLDPLVDQSPGDDVISLDPPEMAFVGPVYGCVPCGNVIYAGRPISTLMQGATPVRVRCTGCDAVSLTRVVRMLRRRDLDARERARPA
jgi:hypothetical protein